MLVAADRKDMPAEPRPAQDEAGDQRQDDHVDDRVGDAEEEGPAAQRQKLVVVRAELEDHRVVGDDHGEAAGQRQHAERDHEGWKIEIGNQDAVEGADEKRRADGRGDADLDGVARMHDHGEHHGAQAEDRAHRQVDAAADDHQRHAQRDDGREGDVPADIVEVPAGGEGIRCKGQIETGGQERDDDPEGLARNHRTQPARLLVFDGLFQRESHGAVSCRSALGGASGGRWGVSARLRHVRWRR